MCLVCGREIEVNEWGYFCCGGQGEDRCWFTWAQAGVRKPLRWYDHKAEVASRWRSVPRGCLFVADRGMA